ncbi:MAG: hypothetical protein IJH83_08445 [Coriobacteriales bacterium]|nr:hypothetical protein [Coriobacteriales bacterium]
MKDYRIEVSHKHAHTQPWRIYKLEIISSSSGELYFMERAIDIKTGKQQDYKVIEKLPVEFFVHQLANLDPNSIMKVMTFCEKWGMITCPFFNAKHHFLLSRRATTHSALLDASYNSMYSNLDIKAQFEERINRFVNFSSHNKHAIEYLAPGCIASFNYCNELHSRGMLTGGIVSFEEVQKTLILMREAIRVLTAIDAEKDFETLARELLANTDSLSFFLEPLLPFKASGFERLTDAQRDDLARAIVVAANEAKGFLCWCAFNNGSEFGSIDLFVGDAKQSIRDESYEGSLAEGIVLQFFDTMAADADWHVCRNESCRRRFKYRQNVSEPDTDLTRPREGHYCRVNCGTIQRRREKIREAQALAEYQAIRTIED